MATPVTTELDFDQIKADIISYIKSDPTFSDYNFEGSALSSIINMLAYNTHTNAYYANMLHNEGFLDTAQKRSSVVSKAKELGYTPKSASGSQAFVDITISNSNASVLTLSRGTQFQSSNSNGSFTFLVDKDYLSTKVLDTDVFTSVRLVEGYLLTNKFIVDTTSNIKSIFTIPNKNIDISTLKLFVRDTETSVDIQEYTKVDFIYNLNAESKVYFLQESYDGYYQVYFGSNIIGYQPINGSVIEIEYIISDNLSLANECRTFVFDSDYGSSTLITTTQVSFGGSEKEDIDSIKYGARLSYTARERAVTISDYEILLKKKFNFIKSVSVWGGEDNIPPIYGKVFISIQPKSGYTISDSVKKDVILPEIKQASMMTIIPEIVDPKYIDVEFSTDIKFNQAKTLLSKTTLESLVKTTISDYIRDISFFNNDYLESNLYDKMMGIDPGIASVYIQKRIGFKLTPLINVETSYTRLLSNKIKIGSVISSKFNVIFDNKPTATYIADNQSMVKYDVETKQETSTLGLYNLDGGLIKEIGSINYTTGEVKFSFSLYSYITNNRFVYFRCKTTNPDIQIFHNQIITLQNDVEDPSVGITSNNIVTTTIYSK